MVNLLVALMIQGCVTAYVFVDRSPVYLVPQRRDLFSAEKFVDSRQGKYSGCHVSKKLYSRVLGET